MAVQKKGGRGACAVGSGKKGLIFGEYMYMTVRTSHDIHIRVKRHGVPPLPSIHMYTHMSDAT